MHHVVILWSVYIVQERDNLLSLKDLEKVIILPVDYQPSWASIFIAIMICKPWESLHNRNIYIIAVSLF